MRTELIDIKWPVALNTDNPDDRNLLPEECRENTNLIRMPNGDLRGHYRWNVIAFLDVEAIISGVLYTSESYGEKLLVFGQQTNNGFLGVIEKGGTELTILSTDFGKYTIPSFVLYKDAVYIITRGLSKYDHCIKYNGKEIEETAIPLASVGCFFRNRLWLMGVEGKNPDGPGVLWFTEVGLETFGGKQNYFEVGNIKEAGTRLDPGQNSIIIGKMNEIWDLCYEDNTYVDSAKLRLRSKRAGILTHRAARRREKTVFCYNDKGCYLIDPENISVNPNQVLQVDPGVFKISVPINNLFDDFNMNIPAIQNVYEREESEPDDPPGEYDWKIGDFSEYSNLAVGEFSPLGIWGMRRADSATESAYGISHVIDLPENYQWGRIEADGLIMNNPSFNETLDLYLKTDTEDWKLVPEKEIEVVGDQYFKKVWDFEIWNDFKDAPKIYYKIVLSNEYTDPRPFLNNIKFTATPKSFALFGAGLFRDKFYLFGEANDERFIWAFSETEGWMKIDWPVIGHIYNLCNEISWDDDRNVIGFGRYSEMDFGFLVTKVIPETFGSNMTIKGKTGRLDNKLPEIPKKLRRINITYKGTGTITLTIYGEVGVTQKQITLPEKTEIGLREINLSGMPRSKWYQYYLQMSRDNFQLKKFQTLIKFFESGEI